MLTGALASQAVNCGGKVDCNSATVFVIDDTKPTTFDRCANFMDEVPLKGQEYPVRLPYYDPTTLNHMVLLKSVDSVRQACNKILDGEVDSENPIMNAPTQLICNYFKIDEKGDIIRDPNTGNTFTVLPITDAPWVNCKKLDGDAAEIVKYTGELQVAEGGEPTFTFVGRDLTEVAAQKGDRYQATCFMPQACPAERRSYRCTSWDADPQYQTCDFLEYATVTATKADWKEINKKVNDCYFVD